jgi:diaminohydroxyphosphoribosylaminopyrimidine deaminase/5-amino-6-(5-phosphoribosylamino)uracil reductase
MYNTVYFLIYSEGVPVIYTHDYFLKKALALAEQRRGFCSPNPSVGAVLLKEGKVVATGLHWKAGDPHAEAAALSGLTPEETTGATIYITLEPCAHTGKTPPCADLLIKHKLGAVYYALKDPNPMVCGKGHDKLIRAGILCEHIPCDDITRFYQSYIWWIKYRRPWVTAKLALSLDGKIAGAEGVPRQITGDALYAYTHLCRMRSDAILTTARTIINDDPQMNARCSAASNSTGMGGGIHKKPVYVLDANLDTPLSAKIFDTAAKICFFHLEGADYTKKNILLNHGAHCVPILGKNGRLSLTHVLGHIGQEGVHDLWVEAGGACFQSFLSESLAQRVLMYIAPKTLGPEATAAFSGTANLFESMSRVTWQQMGQDVLCKIELSSWACEGSPSSGCDPSEARNDSAGQ